jgi:hypothetical protein
MPEWRKIFEAEDSDLPDIGAMEVCSSTEMGGRAASHLGTGGHGPKTDRSRPRSVPGAAAKKSRVLFAEALAWMEKQFEALGKGADSGGCALHLLSATQGVSLLTHTFHDPTMIAREAERLKEWIRAL